MNLTEAKELLKADLLTEADLDALLAAERERCAKVASEWGQDAVYTASGGREAEWARLMGRKIAAAIRASGKEA